MPKPRIIGGICEFCGIKAVSCMHNSGFSLDAPVKEKATGAEQISADPIPKILYSTWISDKPIPEKFHDYIRSWVRVMPDYEIRLITLENCPHNPWIDECLKRKMYCVAGHYARVQRIYETGGIYFDIDVEAIKPFDRFLNDKMFVGMEDDAIINNAVFGARAGHPFLKEQMDLLDRFDLNRPNVELETGIRLFAKQYREKDWNYMITCYEQKFFYPYAWDQEFNPSCIQENTYAVHHWAHSWNNQVSIIIPCYNQEQWLGDAIDSALAQTVQPLEVIVVSDGSPQDTEAVVAKYPPRLVKLIRQDNAGVSAARNAGIRISKGKYIITLDADDKIHPDFIKKTVGVSDVVSTQLRTFGDEDRTWDPPRIYPEYKHFYHENQINCCSLFSKEMWERLDGYDENMRLGYEDWDFWTRAAAEGYKFAVVMEPLFLYRKHGRSMVTGSHEHSGEIRAYMLNKYKAYELETA